MMAMIVAVSVMTVVMMPTVGADALDMVMVTLLRRAEIALEADPVSYTHLTLPTKA